MGVIAYLGLEGNVFTVTPDGSEFRKITDNANLLGEDGFRLIYRLPTWAPNSEKLAFVGISTEDSGFTTMRMFVSEGDSLEEVYSNNRLLPIYFYWVPKSQYISLLASASSDDNLDALNLSGFSQIVSYRIEKEQQQATDLDLLLIPTEGEDEARLLDTGQPYYWSWDPGGTQFLAHVGGSASLNPDARVSIIALDGDSRQDLDLLPAPFRAPAWSPDGAQLLLATVDQEFSERSLILFDLSGERQQTLTTYLHSIAFNWSPDGKKVAYITGKGFSSDTIGSLSVSWLESSGSIITTENDAVITYFWSPDSRKIAYLALGVNPSRDDSNGEESGLQFELHILDVESGEDKRLAFDPTRELLGVLPFFDQYHHSHTIWSPDSTQVVLPSVEDGERVIQIFSLDNTGELVARKIADGVLAFWSRK